MTRAFGDFDCKNIEVPNEKQEKEIKNFVLIEPEVCIFYIKIKIIKNIDQSGELGPIN